MDWSRKMKSVFGDQFLMTIKNAPIKSHIDTGKCQWSNVCVSMINSSKWFQGFNCNKLSMIYTRGLHNHRIKTMINDCASWLRIISFFLFEEPSVYTRLICTCLLCSGLLLVLEKLIPRKCLFKMEIFMDLHMFHDYYFILWNPFHWIQTGSQSLLGMEYQILFVAI